MVVKVHFQYKIERISEENESIEIELFDGKKIKVKNETLDSILGDRKD